VEVGPEPCQLSFQDPLGSHLAHGEQELGPIGVRRKSRHYLPPTICTCAVEPATSDNSKNRRSSADWEFNRSVTVSKPADRSISDLPAAAKGFSFLFDGIHRHGQLPILDVGQDEL
jgi:hypothetical protein